MDATALVEHQYAAPLDTCVPDVAIAQLRRVIPDEMKCQPYRSLYPFVVSQTQATIGLGVDPVDDHVQYLLLALYTSGACSGHHSARRRAKVNRRGREEMSGKKMRHPLLAGLALLLLLPALAACRARSTGIPVGIQGYNHTDTSIPQFMVNGGNGGSVWNHSASGRVCCAVLPAQWSPDLQVEISWTTDLKSYRKVMVAIPKYDEVGKLAVHFLRKGQVKVFSTTMILGNPDYPLTGPEAGLNEGDNPVWEHLRRDPGDKE